MLFFFCLPGRNCKLDRSCLNMPVTSRLQKIRQAGVKQSFSYEVDLWVSNKKGEQSTV